MMSAHNYVRNKAANGGANDNVSLECETVTSGKRAECSSGFHQVSNIIINALHCM